MYFETTKTTVSVISGDVKFISAHTREIDPLFYSQLIHSHSLIGSKVMIMSSRD